MAQNPERDVPTLSATVNWFDRGKRFVFMSFNDSRNGFAPCQYAFEMQDAVEVDRATVAQLVLTLGRIN